jgi:hypothetical protein
MKLTIQQIEQRIWEIESRYYKGWKRSEEFWRLSEEVNTTDKMLWTKYQNMKNQRLKEVSQ